MGRDEILQLASTVIRNESAGIAELCDQLDQSFIDAAYKLLNCKGHVLVTGSGTSHAVGARLAHLLSCCGTPALFIDAGDSQHGLAGAVMTQDVLIALSKGGETVEVNYLASYAKKIGATLIGLTEKPASTLAKMCDVVLKVQAPADIDPYGMIATGSSLVNAAFGDALCVVLLNLRSYTQEEFGKTHPGGAVGIKLSQQPGM
ncbi:MAG TPA: SIS domain-containing protein [Anaerolineaceae bacterium]|nr:SIS domain-containing protein [Anaerolineaceae bacterium]